MEHGIVRTIVQPTRSLVHSSCRSLVVDALVVLAADLSVRADDYVADVFFAAAALAARAFAVATAPSIF